MIRKSLLLLLITFSASFFIINLDFLEKRLLHRIFLSAEEKSRLGREYIHKLKFKIASKKEQILEGESEKYVLIASDGSRWIFKISLDKFGIYTELMGHRLAELCGINIPESFYFTTTINDKQKEGLLIESIPVKTTFSFEGLLSPNNFPIVSENQMYSLMCSLIFDWFISDSLPNSESLISKSGQFYEIDFDKCLRYYFKEKDEIIKKDKIYLSDSNILDRIRWIEFLEENRIEIDFKRLKGIANHIYSMDDRIIEKVIDIALKHHRLKPYILETLSDRKLKLISFFNDYYSKVFSKRVDLHGSPNNI